MKAIIKGYEVECSVEEFKELVGATLHLGRGKYEVKVKKYQPMKNKQWSSKHTKKLLKMIAKGTSWKRIARELGRNVSGCKQRYKKVKEEM